MVTTIQSNRTINGTSELQRRNAIKGERIQREVGKKTN